MNTKKSKVTLHVVASLDGFIARNDNTVSWLENSDDVYEKGITEESAMQSMEPIHCFVMGSRTYEHALVLGWPYGDTPVVVVTTRSMQSDRKSVEFYSGDLPKLVTDLLTPRFQNIWLVGGAVLCQSFLSAGLVDEIRLVIMPVLLGDGLRLFGKSDREERWRLKDLTGYRNGMVELIYESRVRGRSHP